MKILGVDPGLRVTGYGVISYSDDVLSLVEAGVVKTNAKEGIAERLHTIYQGVKSLHEDHSPDVMVLEKLFAHHKHPSTAILMAHARAVVCLSAAEYSTPLFNIPSTRVKKAIISHGHASKEQIAKTVQAMLGLKKQPKPFDVSDALAIAISYALTNKQLKPEVMA